MLTPATKSNIKGLIQCCRDRIIIGLDPATEVYQVDKAMAIVQRYKMHKQFSDKSKTVSEAAKPGFFLLDPILFSVNEVVYVVI